MPFVILLIGAILIITAFNNSFGALATELETDIPAYFKWAAAITAILALGYIPGLKTPSRYLLALVMIVIVFGNYAQILAGFTSFAGSGGTATAAGAGQANPSAAYVANPATTADPTQTQIAGGGSVNAAATGTATAPASAASLIAANPLSPSSYLAAANTFSGFGGIA